MSRIQATFQALQTQGKKGLITFMTAGDPEPEWTVQLMHVLADNGADVIELGIPFSDPMADGPVIQRASERALAKGVNLPQVLTYVSEFRRTNAHTPIVLMGYANPIERMGLDMFTQCAAEAGVDGALIVDYPIEECEGFVKSMRTHCLDPIFLLAPTSTDERILAVARVATGYLYYVSLIGVTGAGSLDIEAVGARIPALRAAAKLPIGVGFGIRDAKSARAIASVADAVVIGSAIVQCLEENTFPDRGSEKAFQSLTEFMTDIRNALDE
ncbi:tryptophan synthase subunit alpha [Candidatus Pandoraea novymonadis]|uniref:Tryptophan synthase alpha chain n=1 Tax=Candidatus Pandoraea novymonadis TaxID=1808959 RepID=A0ABX5FEV3_9BURK|nr:tryptophan synthase subunit alpha [Candidatus Pandoraea novymonadis]PSB92200.1 Tryptophan synthase alpha chain [Candidatus Pandoraea novymonadis]